jgi:hypothetical protein
MPSSEAGRMARRNGYRVRWRNSDWKTPCGAEADPEKVPDPFSLLFHGPPVSLEVSVL